MHTNTPLDTDTDTDATRHTLAETLLRSNSATHNIESHMNESRHTALSMLLVALLVRNNVSVSRCLVCRTIGAQQCFNVVVSRTNDVVSRTIGAQQCFRVT